MELDGTESSDIVSDTTTTSADKKWHVQKVGNCTVRSPTVSLGEYRLRVKKGIAK